MTPKEAATFYGLMLLFFAVCVGVITAKVASDRAVAGSSIFWFIAGALLGSIALPLAIFAQPDKTLLEEKLLASGDFKISAPAFAQIKEWTDENGVVHYENKPPPLPPASAKIIPRADGKTTTPIDRRHIGISLGDDAATIKASWKASSFGADKEGGEALFFPTESLPASVTKLTALAIDGRIALIEITYSNTALGGWEKAVDDTAKKYGDPKKEIGRVSWNDGRTGLILKNGYKSIIATIGDQEAVNRYKQRGAVDAPKF
ncbi:MAG TPA: DUF4124 domain-containing protein [Candidatus Acidoferrales bacterium]|nr:DUF4124 domain-containing protein [Candidatus Acidoferrales bacterium]